MRIRDATLHDMAAVCRLYNALIPTTTVAWTDDLQSVAEREAWFIEQANSGFPVLVAEVDHSVVGFTAYGSFRGAGKWPGYRGTVEHTIHVDQAHWGHSIGRQLLVTLMDRAKANGIHVMVGAIDADNLESIRFHERLGFVQVARMPEVGRKFDRWLDLVLLQKVLD